jgi:hypothetical protein
VALGPQKPGRLAGKDPDGGSLERSKDVHATEELAQQCQELEEELEELKAKYEMYFLGVERLEPIRWREEVKKKVLRLKVAFTRNTGLRFRLQTLHARYLSYERLWLRSAREREEGTYHRDVYKARLHAKSAVGKPAPDAKAPAARKDKVVEDVDLSDWATPEETPEPAQVPRPAASAPKPPQPAKVAPRPAAPAAPPPQRPPPAAPSGMPAEAQLRQLYDTYVAAKKRCNEDVTRLSYDAVAKSVAKQVPELMAKHKAKSVEFKVVIRDGKAVLKAVPKA